MPTRRARIGVHIDVTKERLKTSDKKQKMVLSKIL
jgi:hypothetical protein